MQPLIPGTLLNYILGLTSVKSKDFILGVIIGLLPSIILFTYIGANFQNIHDIVTGKK